MTGTIAGVCGFVLVLIVLIYIQALNKKQQDQYEKQLSHYKQMLDLERAYEKMCKTFTEKLGS